MKHIPTIHKIASDLQLNVSNDIIEEDIAIYSNRGKLDWQPHYTFSCFRLRQVVGVDMNKLAEAVVTELKKLSIVLRVEAIGPYINFRIDEQALRADILSVLSPSLTYAQVILATITSDHVSDPSFLEAAQKLLSIAESAYAKPHMHVIADTTLDTVANTVAANFHQPVLPRQLRKIHRELIDAKDGGEVLDYATSLRQRMESSLRELSGVNGVLHICGQDSVQDLRLHNYISGSTPFGITTDEHTKLVYDTATHSLLRHDDGTPACDLILLGEYLRILDRQDADELIIFCTDRHTAYLWKVAEMLCPVNNAKIVLVDNLLHKDMGRFVAELSSIKHTITSRSLDEAFNEAYAYTLAIDDIIFTGELRSLGAFCRSLQGCASEAIVKRLSAFQNIIAQSHLN